jgi:two-component system response regulator NreC
MDQTGDRFGAGEDRGSRPVTIMLVDDHEIVRAGLRLLLEAEPGFTVVEEAGDLEPALRRVASRRPDVLVLDVQLPGGSSISAIPRLRELSPETRIVMLTMQGDLEAAREALGAGATGYVVKEAARSELIAAVRLAAAGRTYLHPELGAQLIGRHPGGPPAPDELTRRELEVLRLIALGHTNSEIAGQLFLSVRTVESHRAHIQQKTGRATRAQLVAYAREHGLAG